MGNPKIEQLWSSLWASRTFAEGFRLRFELGGEEFNNTTQSVPRFLQAHRRASVIADALFSGSCFGVVAWNGHPPYHAGPPEELEDGFAALHSTGFDAQQISEWRAEVYPHPGDDETYVWTLRSYDLGHRKVSRDTLLWHAIATEMPIYPSAPVLTFLVDLESSTMLHVYDDRGMDVISDDSAKLQGLYLEFAHWLIDYDRERMAKMF
jgi:hypothetical protein